MKLGIVGKGGTGKTTVSALVAQAYVGREKRVLAIDTDSNPNLAMSLGLDESVTATAPLVPRGLAAGVGGGMSPAQLVAVYGLATPAGVTLLHAMRAEHAAEGCFCFGHANVRSLLATTIDEEADVTIVDMEAGLEHLSRSGGTLAHADMLLVVMEPTRKSILTAARTIALARELGIPRVSGVGNKAATADDADFFELVAAEYAVPLAGVVPFDKAVVEADRYGTMLNGCSEEVRAAIDRIVDRVESADEQRAALLVEKEKIERRLAQITPG